MSSQNLPLEINILKQLPTSLQVKETLKNLQKLSTLDKSAPAFLQQLKSLGQSHLLTYTQKSDQNAVNHTCFLNQQWYKDHYVNQVTNESLKVQVFQGLIIQRKPINEQAKLSQSQHKLITLLHQKLSSYVNEHYSQPSAVSCHFTIDNETKSISKVTIGITSKLSNSDNFYAGETISIWNFYQEKYSTFIKAANHFYENGNIIFNRQKPIENKYESYFKVDLSNLNEPQIDNMMKIIKKEQKSYQNELQKLFTKKCGQALKKIRRVTPLSQNKMIWNLNAVRMNYEINQQLPKAVQ